MAYTDPPLFVTGTIPTAAWLNTNVSDNLDYLKANARMKFVSAIPAATFSTASTSYVDWNGATPLQTTFHKREAATRFYVWVYASFEIATAVNTVRFGVDRGGTVATTHPLRRVALAEAGSDQSYCGLADFGTVGAAVYTLTLQVLVISAAGTFVAGVNHFAAMRIYETLQ